MTTPTYSPSSTDPHFRIRVLEETITGYRRDLAELNAELASALGAALVALDDPQLAVTQLRTLIASVKSQAEEQDYRLAPHWRVVEAVLARKPEPLAVPAGTEAA
ncbi:hypothetical protein [Streptacidiphilus sp. EB129]|uniref:hypothetical protein n=1 Tax=Streptacidiphilus sp. EB129 TaxID=3156262 RepID=UPI00351489C0